MEQYSLQNPQRKGVQRVWTDRSQQEGEDGKQCAGFGAWFGDRRALSFGSHIRGNLQTNNQVALSAAMEVLHSVPTRNH